MEKSTCNFKETLFLPRKNFQMKEWWIFFSKASSFKSILLYLKFGIKIFYSVEKSDFWESGDNFHGMFDCNDAAVRVPIEILDKYRRGEIHWTFPPTPEVLSKTSKTKFLKETPPHPSSSYILLVSDGCNQHL